MSTKLITALKDCVSVMERELSGLAVIQPELVQAREALASAMPKPADYDGAGLPPVGTVCEHQWSTRTGTYHRVRILAHEDDMAVFKWLDGERAGELQQDRQSTMGNGSKTFRPFRTPEQIAAKKRIEAAQKWLKGIEREYGVEVADQCENILMAAESRRTAPVELIAADEREKGIAAMLAAAGVTGSAFADDPEAIEWATALYDAGCRMPQGGEA